MAKCCRCDGKGFTMVKRRGQPKQRIRQPCRRCNTTGWEPQLRPLYSEERVLKQLGRWKAPA